MGAVKSTKYKKLKLEEEESLLAKESLDDDQTTKKKYFYGNRATDARSLPVPTSSYVPLQAYSKGGRGQSSNAIAQRSQTSNCRATSNSQSMAKENENEEIRAKARTSIRNLLKKLRKRFNR